MRFEELEAILLRLGFQKRQDGTSHAMYILGKDIVNVPKRRPFVKPTYVELVLKVLEEMKEEDSEA